MNIEHILNILKHLNITGISDDTRYLDKNDLFISLSGSRYRGRDFISEAINKGAGAILSEKEIENCSIPVIKVSKLAHISHQLIAEFYDYPWREMKICGITGTDGKTTTAAYISHLISQKIKTANIGTNGIQYNNKIIKTNYTTLPFCLLVRTLAKFKETGIEFVVLEASSEGLINKRLDLLTFDYACFTNLSSEHLDTHKTIENYFASKLLLFSKLAPRGTVIVNSDSPYSKKLKEPKITFGLDRQAQYKIDNLQIKQDHSTFDLVINEQRIANLTSNITEKYNIYNLLPAIIIAHQQNFDIEMIRDLIKSMPQIPGRLEEVPNGREFRIFIDFAHTPNGLEKLLTSLRRRTKKRLIVVCGSAGNKDKVKRPEMARVATSLADYVFFTTEDPRHEDPLDIIYQMVQGTKKNNYAIVLNRVTAIKKAIDYAKPGDIVAITGKGNDEYFEYKNARIVYSDIAVVKAILNGK